MYYLMLNNVLMDVQSFDQDGRDVHNLATKNGWTVQSNHDLLSFEAAKRIAISASNLKHEVYLPVDRGSHVSPQFTVMKAPEVGDKVSKTINGDHYPVGLITRISTSYRRIETDTGAIFWRRQQSDTWLMDGCWSMEDGHISKQNPDF